VFKNVIIFRREIVEIVRYLPDKKTSAASQTFPKSARASPQHLALTVSKSVYFRPSYNLIADRMRDGGSFGPEYLHDSPRIYSMQIITLDISLNSPRSAKFVHCMIQYLATIIFNQVTTCLVTTSATVTSSCVKVV